MTSARSSGYERAYPEALLHMFHMSRRTLIDVSHLFLDKMSHSHASHEVWSSESRVRVRQLD